MKNNRYISGALAFVVFCLALSGCDENKVTRQSVGKVIQGIASDDGMTLAQVEAILGPGQDLTRNDLNKMNKGKGLAGDTFKKWGQEPNLLILG